MTSLSDIKQAEIIEAFKSTSRYLDDLLNIDNPYFEGMQGPLWLIFCSGQGMSQIKKTWAK